MKLNWAILIMMGLFMWQVSEASYTTARAGRDGLVVNFVTERDRESISSVSR